MSELLLRQDLGAYPAPGPPGSTCPPDRQGPPTHTAFLLSAALYSANLRTPPSGPHPTWLQHKPLPSFQRHCPTARTTLSKPSSSTTTLKEGGV